MSAEILSFSPHDLPTDGGKGRILRRRPGFGMFKHEREDLVMGHADQMPSDSPYCAPDSDPA
jgi:hypothetical protein